MQAALNTPVQAATGDTSMAVGLKLQRQEIRHDESKHFEFLLTESALRWQLCQPSIMALQLDRLISLSKLPSVRLGVLPLCRRVGDGAYHTFVIYDDRLVTVELFSGQLILRDPKDIYHYRELFSYFSGHAFWAQDARTFLTEIAEGFRASK
jgi:hypothetical protein